MARLRARKKRWRAAWLQNRTYGPSLSKLRHQCSVRQAFALATLVLVGRVLGLRRPLPAGQQRVDLLIAWGIIGAWGIHVRA